MFYFYNKLYFASKFSKYSTAIPKPKEDLEICKSMFSGKNSNENEITLERIDSQSVFLEIIILIILEIARNKTES